jgi:23S rRNA pseudouridine2605 synthase
LTTSEGAGPEDSHPPDDIDSQATDAQRTERLQKVMAKSGIGSRRVCEDMIFAGQVTINGQLATLGDKVDPSLDVVAVDGVELSVMPDLLVYLLNKPAGVVTTADDPQGRTTVIELVPDDVRVYPVGRLDMDTEGLLLLTNDGALTHRLTHPSFGVEKEYLAEIDGEMSPGNLRSLREGIDLEDGKTSPALVSSPAPGMVRLVIHEGKNRQVRRMCDAVGHPVKRLVRTRIGPISDAKLKPGTWRKLMRSEVHELQKAVSLAPAQPESKRGDDTA